jgi:hypothetical protein
MKPKFLMQCTATLSVAFSLTTTSSFAQQVTGTLGAPSATTTIDGKQLPPPDPKFGGVIKESRDRKGNLCFLRYLLFNLNNAERTQQ